MTDVTVKSVDSEYLWDEWVSYQPDDRRAVLEKFKPWEIYSVEGFEGRYRITGLDDDCNAVLVNMNGKDRIHANPSAVMKLVVDDTGGHA